MLVAFHFFSNYIVPQDKRPRDETNWAEISGKHIMTASKVFLVRGLLSCMIVTTIVWYFSNTLSCVLNWSYKLEWPIGAEAFLHLLCDSIFPPSFLPRKPTIRNAFETNQTTFACYTNATQAIIRPTIIDVKFASGKKNIKFGFLPTHWCVSAL